MDIDPKDREGRQQRIQPEQSPPNLIMQNSKFATCQASPASTQNTYKCINYHTLTLTSNLDPVQRIIIVNIMRIGVVALAGASVFGTASAFCPIERRPKPRTSTQQQTSALQMVDDPSALVPIIGGIGLMVATIQFGTGSSEAGASMLFELSDKVEAAQSSSFSLSLSEADESSNTPDDASTEADSSPSVITEEEEEEEEEEDLVEEEEEGKEIILEEPDITDGDNTSGDQAKEEEPVETPSDSLPPEPEPVPIPDPQVKVDKVIHSEKVKETSSVKGALFGIARCFLFPWLGMVPGARED